jgi:hypothetical protein
MRKKTAIFKSHKHNVLIFFAFFTNHFKSLNIIILKFNAFDKKLLINKEKDRIKAIKIAHYFCCESNQKQKSKDLIHNLLVYKILIYIPIILKPT